MSIQPGTTLLHYRIVDKIGEGGMGEVWRARDTTLDLRRNLETGSAIKVSSQGGDSAYWSADGNTIYYLAPSGAVMAVDVGEASLGTPRIVVAPAFGLGLFGVADNGTLFLRTRGNPWQAQPLRLLVNWQRRAAQAQ